MKKSLLLCMLALLSGLLVQAAPPTVSASNLLFNLFDGNRLGASFTGGNGNGRIIIMKQGAPVTGLPVNGVDYNANSAFGTSSAQFSQPGEYVIGKTGWADFTATNLTPGTTYYVAIFEYNGSGAGIQYLNVPLTGSNTTVVAPTVQTDNVSVSGVTGNALTLNWSKGNGAGRLIIARKGGPADASPADLTWYNDDASFGVGSQIGTGNFVVYKGSSHTSYQVKNLEPNTTYHFAFYEYNGSNGPMYLAPAGTASFTTNAGPTTTATGAGSYWPEGNNLNVNCSPGNGSRRLFIMRKGAPVTAVPVNGTLYQANSVFGSGTEIAPGEFVVSASSASGFGVTNLEPNATYHFRIFEYDQDKNNYPYYLTSAFTTFTAGTAVSPTTLSTLSLVSTTGSTARIALTGGSGSYRMVILKAGSAVTAAPANLTVYPGNGSFGQGTHMGNGNYVVAWGINGSPLTISNLQPGTTYHAAVYEFNGNAAPVYSNAGAAISFAIPLEPTAAATAPWSISQDGRSFRVIWTSGNGARRIVVARKGSAVTSVPQDGQSYTANAAFGQGTQLNAGEYVVFDGTDNYVDVKNMDFGSTYHFAVYEYNVGAGGNSDYLTSAFLTYSYATSGTPTTQGTLTSVTSLQATSANVNFTGGNGGGRMLVIRQGGPVDAQPLDGTKYNYSNTFGTATAQLGTGNYIFLTTNYTGYASISNLQPNTSYSVSMFEYNGTNEPVYLRTSVPVLTFTTPDVPGATVPSTASSAPLFSAIEGNKFTFKWTAGNGTNRIVIARKDGPVSFVPASATSYTANSAFGSGTDLGSGQYVVYNGNGAQVDLTGLQPSSTYYFAVYEFNGTGVLLRYGTAALTASAATATAPTAPVSSVQAQTASGRITLSWAGGNGAGRIIILRDGGPVTTTPSDLSVYPFNTLFTSAPQVALGEYVVYNGSANTVTITGLTNNHTYHYAIFEYNGSAAPVYRSTGVTGSTVVSSALPVQLLYFTAKEKTGGVELEWATASELDHDRFEVQRGTDGQHFQTIQVVNGLGNSNTTKTYRYTDSTPARQTTYYRLKQIDRSGEYTYSTVAIIRKQEAGIALAPNPAQNSFRIQLPSGITKANISLFDATGKQVLTQQTDNGQIIDITRLAPGFYVVRVQSGNVSWETRIIKQ